MREVLILLLIQEKVAIKLEEKVVKVEVEAEVNHKIMKKIIKMEKQNLKLKKKIKKGKNLLIKRKQNFNNKLWWKSLNQK